MMTRLETGDRAPEFTLTAQDGARISLAQVRERASQGVVVYFYPKAGTPGCTTEACDFRDNLASLGAAGYEVLGVSADPIADLQAFAAEEQLTFPLLSDDGAQVAREYGAWGEKTINGATFEGVLRSTFVIGSDGLIRSAEYNVEATGHVARLREQLLG